MCIRDRVNTLGRHRTLAAHLHPMTTTPATAHAPKIRMAWGAPLRWTSPGTFGVLLSSTDYVTANQYDPATQALVPVLRADDAAELAATILKAQPGIEFEGMRLEDEVWRDFQGRTRSEVTAARWLAR